MARIRLTTIGRTELTGPDGSSILSVLSQPKRFALLVYLAVEGSERFVRRDRLVAVFWPELDHERARAGLRKSLWFLRRSLGPGVIVTRGDEVRVDSSLLSCDAALRDAPSAGAAPAGDRAASEVFLDAFHFGGASPAWYEWVDRQRRRLAAHPSSAHDPAPPGGHGEGASDEPPVPSASTWPARRGRSRSTRAPWLGAAVLASAALAWLFAWRARDTEAPAPLEMVIPLPTSGVLANGQWMDIAPSGGHVAYIGRRAAGEPIWIRALSSAQPRPVPGSEGARLPFFSADGAWIGFTIENRLLKAPTRGGPAVQILALDGAVVEHAVWGPDGLIVTDLARPPDAAVDTKLAAHAGLVRIDADRANGSDDYEVLTELSTGEIRHRDPDLLPDGRGVLFEIRRSSGSSDLAVLDLDTRRVKPLGRPGRTPRYAPSGHVFYSDAQGAVFALPFDVEALEVTGQPEAVGLTVNLRPTGADYDIARDGTLVRIPPYELRRRLVRVDRSGTEATITDEWRAYQEPRLSPQGDRVVFSILRGPLRSVWMHHVQDGRQEQLTSTFSRRPVWHPSGEVIGFMAPSGAGGPWTGYRLGLSRGEPAVPIGQGSAIHGWSPDGAWRLRSRGYAGAMSVEHLGTGTAVELAPDIDDVTFSPDGRWIVFDSDASGRFEVYVQGFPELGPPFKVSDGGGRSAAWSPSGPEVFYVAQDGLISVRLSLEGTPAVLSRQRLFEFPYLRAGYRQYDVFPDGESFLAVREGEPDVDIVLTVDWIRAWQERRRAERVER